MMTTEDRSETRFPGTAPASLQVGVLGAVAVLAVAVAAGLVGLGMPLLLLFVTGLHGLVERRGGEGADWSRLATVAGAAVSGIFVLVNVLQMAIALSAGALTHAVSRLAALAACPA